MKTPEAMKPVLAWDGRQWVRAMWVPKFTEDAGFNDNWCEYNAADDTYYLPEGWYERQSHSGDALVWHIHCGVTEWRELPPPPGEAEPVTSEYVPSGWGLFIGNVLSARYSAEDMAHEAKRSIESMPSTTAPIEVRQLFSRANHD
jgi:hypothetical protein